MAAEQVNLTISLTGYYYNHWPNLKILHNNVTVFDQAIVNDQQLVLALSCDKTNRLEFIHHGKSFGEEGIWDSNADASEQCFINIKDILFDQVSIGETLKSKLMFDTAWSDLQLEQNTQEFLNTYSKIQCYGMMNFNGSIVIDFDTPIYNWLIFNKYKVPMTDTAYFSNYSARWHYEEDLKVIDEIKELIHFDKNRSN
jgi:hypothetical protein